MATWRRSSWSRRRGWSALGWKVPSWIFILLTSQPLRKESQSILYPWHKFNDHACCLACAQILPSPGGQQVFVNNGCSIKTHFPKCTHTCTKYTHTYTQNAHICANTNHLLAPLLPFTLLNMVHVCLSIYKHQHNCITYTACLILYIIKDGKACTSLITTKIQLLTIAQV